MEYLIELYEDTSKDGVLYQCGELIHTNDEKEMFSWIETRAKLMVYKTEIICDLS